MELNKRVAVVTGAAQGIGLALCERFAREGAQVVVADLDGQRAEEAAARLGGLGLVCDVTAEAQIQALVAAAIARYGRIDLFCSNAGVLIPDDGPLACDGDDRAWMKSWEVNVMAHVYAARAVVPHMRARGQGYLLNMVSAAGLLNQIGAASYTATKHAALAFAESLAIDLHQHGIRVSAICPAYVATALIGLDRDAAPAGVLSTEAVAAAVVQGVMDERFLILPHPEVAGYLQHKIADEERWLAAMRKLRSHTMRADGSLDWPTLFAATAPK